MDKPVIEDMKMRFASLVDSYIIATTSVDCGLQTMRAINFLSREIQYLANHGITLNMRLIHEIWMDCANFYKSVQSSITETKSSLDDSMVIDLPILKQNTMPNSM